MKLPPIIQKLERILEGEPDSILTLLLLGLAAIIVFIALEGNPVLKAALAAWIIIP
jgi:hypothetical protein